MLEKILEKPEAYRRNLALLLTAVIGVLVVSVWLTISSYRMKQAFLPDENNGTLVAQDFKSSLPSLRQTENVTTELTKQKAAKAGSAIPKDEEEKKPFWKLLLGK